jgi:integrase
MDNTVSIMLENLKEKTGHSLDEWKVLISTQNFSKHGEIVKFLKEKRLDIKLTTHSFRYNFITELWRDTGDIVFVQKFMGHTVLASTSAYICNVTEAEKIKKLLESHEKKIERKTFQ